MMCALYPSMELVIKTLLCVILVLPTPVVFGDTGSALKCQSLFNNFTVKKEVINGFEYEVKVPSDRKKVLDVLKDFKEGSVFLGITHEGHYYFMVGNKRYDGSYFPNASIKSEDRNSNGYLIHFSNVSKEKAEKWIKRFKKGSRGISLSCVSGACRVLKKDFDIRVKGVKTPLIFSYSSFRLMLENGFVDAKGNTVEVDIYRTSARGPEFQRMKTDLILENFSMGLGSLILMAGTVAAPFLMGQFF